jgi:hypothetical protein
VFIAGPRNSAGRWLRTEGRYRHRPMGDVTECPLTLGEGGKTLGDRGGRTLTRIISERGPRLSNHLASDVLSPHGLLASKEHPVAVGYIYPLPSIG